MGTPTGTDPIILEPCGDERWAHRYGPAPDGYWLYGRMVCCERAIYIPGGASRPLHQWHVFPHITDCCDTPGTPKPFHLPPYSGEHTTCRKCGSKAVETRHTTGARSAFGIRPAGYPPEWLARRCAVCQATWDETCIAAEGDADA